MIVAVKENRNRTETTIDIHCKEVTQDILELERHIKLFSKTLLVKERGEFVQVSAKDIFYMETVDRRTFVYTEKKVFETDFRLYELEERLTDFDFFRASKSIIVNLQKIEILAPELNRMMLAIMKNNEKIYISRKYARALKEVLVKTSSSKGEKR